ncbi:MAG: hypothetical protein IPG11_12950 [Flavobacteriales bacterium]|nr:hypothetical protein [Flavobacteriales bacterium]
MAWIQFLTLPVLGMRIAWEDLRERSIHWVVAPGSGLGAAAPPHAPA